MTPTPTGPQAVDDYVVWEIGDEVSEEDRLNALHAVQLMHDYAVSLGMPQIEKDITFYLYHNHDALIDAYVRVTGWSLDDARDNWGKEDGTGEAGEGWAFVYTAGSWVREDPLNLTSLSAGEFVGALSFASSELSLGSGTDEVPKAGPRWLDEGFHTILQIRALAAGGVISYDTKRNSTNPWGLVEHAKYVGKQPLNEMETWTGFIGIPRGNPNDYVMMAGELLAAHAGESSLIRYYTNLKIGTPWQKTFQNTFGMTVEEFYVLFEEHRDAGFPELELPK